MANGSCQGPRCRRPTVAHGLCFSHYKQQLRDPGRPLRPIRDLNGPRRIQIPGTALYVAPATIEVLETEAAERGIFPSQVARFVLDGWAERRLRERKRSG